MLSKLNKSRKNQKRICSSKFCAKSRLIAKWKGTDSVRWLWKATFLARMELCLLQEVLLLLKNNWAERLQVRVRLNCSSSNIQNKQSRCFWNLLLKMYSSKKREWGLLVTMWGQSLVKIWREQMVQEEGHIMVFTRSYDKAIMILPEFYKNRQRIT